MLFLIAFGVPLLLLGVLAALTVRRDRIRARAMADALRDEDGAAGTISAQSARRARADIRSSRAFGYYEPPPRSGEGHDGTPLAPGGGE